jgi:PAS domain S-box-containing protein
MGRDDRARLLAVSPDGRLDEIATALRSVGHTVDVVDDVGAVVDAAEADAYDGVIVLDAPATEDADALDGPSQVRQLDVLTELPVVVYTPKSGQEALIKSFEAGAADICRVPPGRTELLDRKISYAVGVGGAFDDERNRLRSLFDAYPEDLFIKDEYNRLANHTGKADHLEYLDAEWYTNLSDYELFPPEFADFLYEEERAVIENETVITDKIEHFQTPTGQDRWVSTTKAPRYDEDGTVVGIVGASLEVTDVKRQERQLAALSTASRSLTRAETRDGIAQSVVDIATEISPLPRVQVAYVDDTGELYPPVSGTKQIDPLAAAPPFETHEQWYHAAAEDGSSILAVPPGTDVPPLDEDVTVERTDDVSIPGLFIPLGDHGVIGFVTDGGPLDGFPIELAQVLAANAQAALERVERQRQLAETTDRFREFTLLGSHELRNRIQTVFGQIARLKDDPDGDTVAELESTVESVDRLVSQLVTLGQTGSVATATQSVDLESAAADAWNRIDPDAATLVCEELPTIQADPSSLVELLDHLLENAVEHAGSGVTVTVGWLEDDRGFYVADDGPGMSSEMVERAFDIDWDAAARRSGYGLYVVSTITDAHGWAVEIDDAADGTRLEIRGVTRLS